MISALNSALYSRLGGTATNAGTALFYMNAPDNQPLPFVVWDYVSDMDENQTQHRTRNAAVFIRAYATTQSAAGAIDGQIDTLLHNKPLSVTGYNNFWLMREGGHSFVETDESGCKTYMEGADYRVRLEKT